MIHCQVEQYQDTKLQVRTGMNIHKKAAQQNIKTFRCIISIKIVKRRRSHIRHCAVEDETYVNYSVLEIYSHLKVKHHRTSSHRPKRSDIGCTKK